MLNIGIENGGGDNVDLAPLLVDLYNRFDAMSTRMDSLENVNAQQDAIISTLNNEVDSLQLAVEECCGGTRIGGLNGNPDLPELGQNHPNPFDGSTTIHYYVPISAANAHINVVAPNGQLMANLAIEHKGDGYVILNTEQFAAGAYIYTLYVNSQVIATRTMTIVR